MTTTIAAVLIVIVFALIVIATFIVHRQRNKIKIKGPLGTGLELDSSNDPTPSQAAIKAEGIKSREGGLMADDQTGRGIDVKQVDVKDDVLLGSTSSRKDSE